MIPRYLPNLDFPAWILWLLSNQRMIKESQKNLLKILDESDLQRSAYAVAGARQGLFAYFKHLREVVGHGTVILSSQICPIVPQLIKKTGLSIRFIDIDSSYPTPSATQYIEAIDQDVVAMVIAPFYGHIQNNWTPLFQHKLNNVNLVLDLAQGLTLGKNLIALVQKSDAVVYSFSLGKGVDTGGGLLLTNHPLHYENQSRNKKGHYLSVLLKGIALYILAFSGLYPYFLKMLEEKINQEKINNSIVDSSQLLAPSDIYFLWERKIKSFFNDVERARNRAIEIGTIHEIQKNCRDLPIYCGPTGMHLRQILRFKNPSLRTKAINILKNNGIDCAPAGELLPSEYLDFTEQNEFPNANNFRRGSVRLPFLGRMTDKQFRDFKNKLEISFAQHLS